MRIPALALALATAAHAQLWEDCNVLRTHAGPGPGSSFGWVGREAGDVDGDGVLDLVVGAPGYASGAGRAFVYSGASGQLLFLHDGAPASNLGSDVAPAGDVDGDGFGDVLVGAPGGLTTSVGHAVVLAGPAGGVMLSISSGLAGDLFGASVEGVGDVDGDGTPDLLVGATLDDTTFTNAGRAYVYSGTGALLRTHEGNEPNANFGSAAGAVGDRNHDGHADYIVGAHNAGPANGGRAFVYDGKTGATWQAYAADATGVAFGQFFAGRAGDVDADGTPTSTSPTGATSRSGSTPVARTSTAAATARRSGR